MADSDKVYRIYAQIVNGVKKRNSVVPLDEELSKLWDKISAQVAETKGKNIVWEIPNEMPSVDPVDPSLKLVVKAVDADLVKAGRNAIDEALAKLDEIPMVDSEHVAVPWAIAKRPKLNPEVWADSEIVAVPIEELFASQKLLTKSRVAFYIKNPGAIEAGRRAFANVYALDERMIIVDGHHRLAALWLLEAELANVWFLEE